MCIMWYLLSAMAFGGGSEDTEDDTAASATSKRSFI